MSFYAVLAVFSHFFRCGQHSGEFDRIPHHSKRIAWTRENSSQIELFVYFSFFCITEMRCRFSLANIILIDLINFLQRSKFRFGYRMLDFPNKANLQFNQTSSTSVHPDRMQVGIVQCAWRRGFRTCFHVDCGFHIIQTLQSLNCASRAHTVRKIQ